MFFRLEKAAAAQRVIYATIDEAPDRSGEQFDYATSKPNFQAWSNEMKKASGGKSLGNVRAMHSLNAIGKLEDIAFDDDAKAIRIVAKVVDDEAWRKVEEGVFTGISPGGKKKFIAGPGPYRRYTGLPSEISLVDVPCIPSATFTMVKADGGEETVKLKEPDAAQLLAADLADASDRAGFRAVLMAQAAEMMKALWPGLSEEWRKADYSSDERDAMAKSGEAEEDGSYPIKTKSDLEDAIQAFGRSKDKAKTKAHIVKRATALGLTDELPEDWDGSTKKKDMKKGLDEVAQLASLLSCLTWLSACVADEGRWEEDKSGMPKRLAAWIVAGAEILPAMATEEAQEAIRDLTAAVASLPAVAADAAMAKSAAELEELAKAGARNSKGDMARIQAIHDHASDLGAVCGDDMAKSHGLQRLAHVAGDLAEARGAVASLAAERDDWKKRYDALAAQPAPGGPRLRVAERGDPPDARAQQGAAELIEIEKLHDGPDKAARLVRHAMTYPAQPKTPS